jgi:8-oxo-dGTP pyrophosphatase MutT (NUDIX family)
MKVKDLQEPKKQGAGCLIFCSDTDRFLLIKRSEYVAVPNTWNLPGGGVDGGETPEQAARREMLEEIGFDIDNHQLKLIYTNEVYAPRFKYYTFAIVVGEEFKPTLNYESSDYIWCNLDNIPEPLHWGLSQLINHDKSAKLLKSFIDDQKNLMSNRQ